MSAVQSKAIGVGVLFPIIFLSGFWLSNSGRPLNTIVFTVHKLVAVATVILLGVTLYRTNQVAPLSAIQINAGAVTGLLFLSTIVTGGLVSTDNTMPALVTTLHRITPYLTVLATAWLLWQVLPLQASVLR
jgi:hypothetical protein